MLEYVNMKKYKYFLIFALVVILLPLASTVFALELTYPNIPGFGALGQRATLPQFIGYFFTFAFTTVGIIGVLIIAISGVKILISAGNPTAISDARERIWNAVLGIILLMFSVVLLREVNPNLINPRTSVLPATNGLYFVKDVSCGTDANCQANYPDGKDYKPGPLAMANSAETIPAGFTKLSYKCTGGPNLLVWVYDHENYEVNWVDFNPDPNTSAPVYQTTYRMPCSQNEIICDGSNNNSCNTLDLTAFSIQSYKTDIEKPGVYFYLKNNCDGLSSTVLQTSGDIPNFASNFQGGEPPVRAMRIVNTDNLNRYGVVVTQHYKFDGECSAPIIRSDTGSDCYPIPDDSNGNVFNPFSAYVIKQAQWYPENSETTLYSANLYVTLGFPNTIKQYSIYSGFSGDNGYDGTVSDFLKNNGFPWRTTAEVTNDPENETTAPTECLQPSDDPETDDVEGNYVCLNYIENTGSFDIFLYGEVTGTDGYKSCKFFPNGLIADDWVTANTDFKNLLFGSTDLYRMDIIPRPY